jgi:iron complex transport system substrate-binding protein
MRPQAAVTAALVVLLLCVPLAGCYGPPAGPTFTTVQDGKGFSVSIRTPVERVVSLVPSHTEIMFAIGAGQKVVGGTDYDNFPPEAANVTDVLVNLQVNMERLVSLNPDVVLVSSLNAEADVNKMRDLNLSVFYADADAVSDVPPMIVLIGKAVGEVSNATTVAAQLSARIGSTQAVIANTTTKPRTFYLLDDYGAWWTSGNKTRGDDLIRFAGGTNIFSNATGWTAISLEAVAAKNPEVIIVGLYVQLTLETMNTTQPWKSMSAVVHGHVYRVPDADLVDRPGPRLSEGLDWMARAIHPEAF